MSMDGRSILCIREAIAETATISSGSGRYVKLWHTTFEHNSYCIIVKLLYMQCVRDFDNEK